ncbi:MAG: OmpA family protein [Rhodospirillales bacterium]|nr:OmpA family protein [Rhodospirillales bacterium]
MKLRSALLAATVLALPMAAYAGQPVTGVYVGGGLGINYMQPENLTASGPGFSVSNDVKSHIGLAGVLSLGYGFGNGLRAEVEGDFRNNQFSDSSAGSLGNVGGFEQKFGPMVNVLYDFNGLSSVLTPYVGVGVGYQWTNFQNIHGYSGATSYSIHNHTPGAFAYQAILGVAYPIAAAPGLSLTAEYRFMGLAGTRDFSGTSTTAGVTKATSFSAKDDYNHSVLIGLRYEFGAAPPPPAPAPMVAPAPAPARSYLVFFDWDKATLSDRARSIIHEAAENSMKVKYTAIEVNGYTDTSGTAKYNMGLSVRRAQAVAAELVRDGVPKSAIAIQGFGETHPLVPTGPGVREPQNRRVEIIIK